jgi:7-cyano-7-deazaguanine synthase
LAAGHGLQAAGRIAEADASGVVSGRVGRTLMLTADSREGQESAGRARSAVLCSAGLDSAVLVALLARSTMVTPLYVSVGLAWERAEQAALTRLLEALPFVGGVLPAVTLSLDMRDLYPSTHWAVRGTPPAYDTPDEDVYIVGRNVVLLTKAAICCAYRQISRLAIGPLAGNPFPDATPQFFATMGRALSLGLAHDIEIVAPFASMDKADVIRLGVELGVPLVQTLSCMNPSSDGRHCGRCSKCRERRDAFVEAEVADPTDYAAAPPR